MRPRRDLYRRVRRANAMGTVYAHVRGWTNGMSPSHRELSRLAWPRRMRVHPSRLPGWFFAAVLAARRSVAASLRGGR